MKGQRAVITGATGGIGSAITRRLASDGYQVVACYRQAADADALVAGLVGHGHSAFPLDVTDADSLESLRLHVDRTMGRLDVLVNCAGITRPVAHDDLDALDDELIDRIFRTNWRGAFGTVRALLPALRASKSATVVNISSIGGRTGQGSNVAYCASKAALDSMTRSLGRALAPTVRVVSVSPGWVLGEYADRADPNMLIAQTAATPLERLPTPDDVAEAVVCAIKLQMTTGCVIPVDGGRELGRD